MTSHLYFQTYSGSTIIDNYTFIQTRDTFNRFKLNRNSFSLYDHRPMKTTVNSLFKFIVKYGPLIKWPQSHLHPSRVPRRPVWWFGPKWLIITSVLLKTGVILLTSTLYIWYGSPYRQDGVKIHMFLRKSNPKEVRTDGRTVVLFDILEQIKRNLGLY